MCIDSLRPCFTIVEAAQFFRFSRTLLDKLIHDHRIRARHSFAGRCSFGAPMRRSRTRPPRCFCSTSGFRSTTGSRSPPAFSARVQRRRAPCTRRFRVKRAGPNYATRYSVTRFARRLRGAARGYILVE